MIRRRPIHATELHSVGGTIAILEVRDRDGELYYRIRHTSRGGDLFWLSERISNVDRADAGAEVLAGYLGAGIAK